MEFKSDINKARQVFDFYYDQLVVYYTQQEVRSMLYMLFDEYLKMKKSDVLLNPDNIISESQFAKLSLAIDDLKEYRPLQYIIGKTNFYGLDFVVKSGVLIPRPETEELVHWIINDNERLKSGEDDGKFDILDIGCGSGIISICLDKFLSGSHVRGLDIQDDVIKTAIINNQLNKTNVDFFQFDILNESRWEKLGEFDIIVSNPPYVRDSEKNVMSRNVKDYEPESALFVSDDDPLVFYKSIIKFSLSHLKPKGKIYFEINEAFGEEMIKLLEDNGFSNIILKKDLHGKDRMMGGCYEL